MSYAVFTIGQQLGNADPIIKTVMVTRVINPSNETVIVKRKQGMRALY